MLSPLRRPVLSHHARRALLSRSYSTEPPLPVQPSDLVYENVPTRLYQQARRNQLWVRCRDDGVSTLPEFLAILRAVERDVGKVMDYHFNRDPYDSERLEKWFRVRTEDPDVWAQVPKEGKTLHVQLPTGFERRPGGCSLADIQPLLQAQDKVPEDVTQAEGWQPEAETSPKEKEKQEEEKGGKKEKKADPSMRSIEVVIQRTVWRDNTKPTFVVSKERRDKIGKEFVGWGGFYQPKDLGHVAEEEAETLQRMQRFRERYGAPSVPAQEAQESLAVEAEDDAQVLPEEPEPRAEVLAEEPEPASTEPPVILASATEPAASPSPVSPPSPTSAMKPPGSGRAKRREMLLELARQNATMPLPEAVRYPEPEKTEEEQEAQKAEKQQAKEALRERVWKLMGGLLP